MSLEEALTLARVFSRYLNLMGIAEVHHRVHRQKNVASLSKSCDDIFNQLLQRDVSPDHLYDTVCKQEVEIALTAHILHKLIAEPYNTNISDFLLHLLNLRDRSDLTSEDRDMVIEDQVREITSVRQTDELRHYKPTPVDEARAGLNIVEQSLWKAVPHYLRRVSNALKKVSHWETGKPLPLKCTPIRFGSRMRGDQDENPNVTAKELMGLIDISFINLLLVVTKDVSLLSRWMTIDLYIREVDNLKFELSMNWCSDSLSKLAQEILEHESASEDH
ncbi:putative phosphoenolpyruvate carboxylase [Rosa chinensis]|uniref:Putative phosphoenolpyruvate carboxylase n=1 Tax=Rosa chinensis TaxID=74649 RepID=A0A2P6SNV0_ROSCH|nr:putative phosphoenolpyruvate carboxylase [Rosa chinensis]